MITPLSFLRGKKLVVVVVYCSMAEGLLQALGADFSPKTPRAVLFTLRGFQYRYCLSWVDSKRGSNPNANMGRATFSSSSLAENQACLRLIGLK